MEQFEGYVGIRLWDGQLADDIVFFLLLFLIIVFSVLFRIKIRQFGKMLRDVFFVKERQNLFDEANMRGDAPFRFFMTFQALYLSSITLYAIGKNEGLFVHTEIVQVLGSIGLGFILLLLFFLFKQCCYTLLGYIFTDPEAYRIWRSSYHATIGIWGVTLYFPALWLVFINEQSTTPAIALGILYLLSRFLIIYKIIRIFYKKSISLLYIILYLCAQEILPLVFLYEGMVYLYNFIETNTLWH